MKRVILSGIELKTSKFTCPSIKTDDQRNALEAFEIAVTQKPRQFEAFCDRQMELTSSSAWTGDIFYDGQGYYIVLEATRSQFGAYVLGDEVVRKPRNSSQAICHYSIKGENGTVYYMSNKQLTAYGREVFESNGNTQS